MMERALLFVFLSAFVSNEADAVFSNSTCGTKKVCFSYPETCDPATAECIFFSSTWNGTHFSMELSGGAGEGNEYTSVAFGQVDGMQDADLYYCTGNSLESGVITSLHDPPTTLNNDEPGISDIVAATNNGVAECTFSRTSTIVKNITGNVATDFNLLSKHYILLAHGNIVSDTGKLGYHHGNKTISSAKMDLLIAPATEPSQDGSSTTVTTESKSTTSTAAPTTSTPTTTAQDNSCKITDNCFAMPENCLPEDPECVRFTWTYANDKKTFKMKITGGGIGDGSTYAGVALGELRKWKTVIFTTVLGSP